MTNKLTVLNVIDLKIGCWYVGRGRNANVGLWNGEHFMTIGSKFGQDVIKYEIYYTSESGTFQPFKRIEEGKMIEPFGTIGWDAHYGRSLEL